MTKSEKPSLEQSSEENHNPIVDFDEIRSVFQNFKDKPHIVHNVAPSLSNTTLEPLAQWYMQSKNSFEKAPIDNAKLVLFHSHNKTEALSDADLEVKMKDAEAHIELMKKGDHILNELCASLDCSLQIYEMNSENPLQHISGEPSQTINETAMALTYGMMVVEQQTHCLLVNAFGAGTDDIALQLLKNDEKRGFDALHYDGSREITALCGSLIAAKLAGIPVLLEGVAGLCALKILFEEEPNAITHCLWNGSISELENLLPENIQNRIITTDRITNAPSSFAEDMLFSFGTLKLVSRYCLKR